MGLSKEPFLETLFSEGRSKPISFEVFPPKTPSARETLRDSVARLADARPAFFSVTYSPDGSSRERTLEVAAEIKQMTGIPVAAHLTAWGSTKAQIEETADRLWEAGIYRIVALRGDRPDDHENRAIPRAYPHAAELVAALKARHDFDISVAAYPEKHPEAESLDADIDHLKEKLDAGASRAVCQFVLDPADYGAFLDRCAARGIDKPVVPGVMVLTHWPRARRFARQVGAKVPAWLDDLFDGLEGEPEAVRLTAMTVVQEQVRRLVAHGAPALHFYTMNHWAIPLTAAHLLGRHIGDTLSSQTGYAA